jgi:hypothetical protein
MQAVVYDRTCSLDEVPQALPDVGAGRPLGKIVVVIDRHHLDDAPLTD